MSRLLTQKLVLCQYVLPLVVALVGCGGSSGGSGGSPQVEMLYAGFDTPNGGGPGGQIVPMSLNTSSGALTPMSGVVGPGHPVNIIADPNRQFLYSSDFNTDTVYAYSIGTDGSLTAIAGSPYSTPFSGNGGPVGIDPAGKFVFFVADPNGDIVTFIRNSSNGTLTLSPAPVVQDMNQPIELIVDPSGKFLYTANHADPSGNEISIFSIDATTGGLTPVPGSPFPFLANSEPWGMAMSNTGAHLYTALWNAGSVAALSVNSTTGAVNPLPNSPFPTGVLIPQQLVLHPSGKFLYTGNLGIGSISAFSVDASTGALTTISGSPFNSGGPIDLAVDPSGKFLFVSQNSFSPQLAEWTINQNTGALSSAATTNFSGGPAIALTVLSLP